MITIQILAVVLILAIAYRKEIASLVRRFSKHEDRNPYGRNLFYEMRDSKFLKFLMVAMEMIVFIAIVAGIFYIFLRIIPDPPGACCIAILVSFTVACFFCKFCK